MTPKQSFFAILVAFIIGGGVGYFTKEEKIITVDRVIEKLVQVEEKTSTRIEVGPKVKTTKETRVDGTVLETRIEVGTKVTTRDSQTETSEKETSVEKIIERSSPRPSFSLGAQVQYSFEDLMSQRFDVVNPMVTAGYRLVGDLWLESTVLVVPKHISKSYIGLGFRVEF